MTPRAAVVKTTSFWFLYLRLPLVSKLLNPWAYFSLKFAFGLSPECGVSLNEEGTLFLTSPRKGSTANF